MAQVLKERIESNNEIAPGIYRMTVGSRVIAQEAQPGQFVNVKCCEGLNAFLRRPISICSVNRERNTYDIVYQVKGTGTEYLSKKKAGDGIDVIGPLGKPFYVSPEYGHIAVVGGGIGIFPLLFLMSEYNNVNVTAAAGWEKASGEKDLGNKEFLAFLGFRSADYVVLTDEFGKYSDRVHISTDDGSKGYKGLITDLLVNELQNGRPDIIYTCGPKPMLKKVVEIAESESIKCQVSLEQRMGCGIGACLVCACKTREGDSWEYSHVCKDGPVFWASDLILDE